jgi:hypothetical protein
MYLDTADGIPTGNILYQSHTSIATSEGGSLILVGTGKDNDHLGGGIVAFEWASSLDGTLGTTPSLNIPAASLSLGVHEISFQVQDAEGNWSPVKTVHLLVGEVIYDLRLPLVVSP